MFLGINNGFWLGIGLVAAVTIAMIIVAWALPPKSKAKYKNNNKNDKK